MRNRARYENEIRQALAGIHYAKQYVGADSGEWKVLDEAQAAIDFLLWESSTVRSSAHNPSHDGSGES